LDQARTIKGPNRLVRASVASAGLEPIYENSKTFKHIAHDRGKLGINHRDISMSLLDQFSYGSLLNSEIGLGGESLMSKDFLDLLN
jgi:hypothetical protein